MAACLSEQDLESYVAGSASTAQISAWKSHFKTCDSCALRLARRREALDDASEPTPEPPTPPSDGPIREGTRLGDFEIEERLGSGGMGIVYRARQISLGRRVALKVLPPGLGMTSSAVVRFHREAQAAAKLHHSNIVAVYSEGEQDGTCFYAMELIEGKGLDQIIAEWRQPDAPAVSSSAPTVTVGATPPPTRSVRASASSVSTRTGMRSTREHFDTIAKWVADAADALDYAHKQGVIHRDIKPSNLMLGGDGRLSVMDFGLARMLEEPGMTVSGEFLGTPRYMSPEQIAVGRAKLDHRTDIYSLGVTLYELMTQQPLFPGEHRDEIIAAIMAKEPTRPRQVDRHVPVDLETICLKAIEKDPDRRYSTAGEFSEDLRHYLHRDTIAARRAGPVRRIVKFAHRHKAPAAVAATVLLVTSIAVGLAWKYWPQPRLTLVGQTQLTSDPGLTTDPTLSPDGVLLAYASDRGGNDNLDIWVQPVAGGEPRQLTTDPADDHEPAFAPDGETIVFRSERNGGGVYIMPVAAGEPSSLARLLAPLGRRPRFSPDGTFVAYWVGRRGSGDPERSGKIHVVPVPGGSPTQLQSHFPSARWPIWAPDGKHILFLGYGTPSATASSEAREWDWWLAPLEGGPAVRTGVFDAFRAQEGISWVSSLELPAPGTWLPRENRVIFSGSSGGAWKLWSLPMSAETGTVTGSLQQLTSGSGHELHPWATSGGRVVFENPVSNTDVWSLPIQANEGSATGEPERLTDNPALDAFPCLSADGTTIVFASGRSGDLDVWLMDLQTRAQKRLTDEPSYEFAPYFSADGSKVAYTTASIGQSAGIIVRTLNGSEPDWSFEVPGTVLHIASDGGEILYQPHEAGMATGRVHSLNVDNRKTTKILDDPEVRLYLADLTRDTRTRDARWIAFLANHSQAGPPRAQVLIAPYRAHTRIERNQWIEVTDGWGSDDKPRWSPDGNLLYFTSDRDGFRCIWAQRLHTETKRPVGEPLEVHHFHRTRLSMLNVDLGSLELSVARDRVVFCLRERKGNIWMAELTEK